MIVEPTSGFEPLTCALREPLSAGQRGYLRDNQAQSRDTCGVSEWHRNNQEQSDRYIYKHICGAYRGRASEQQEHESVSERGRARQRGGCGLSGSSAREFTDTRRVPSRLPDLPACAAEAAEVGILVLRSGETPPYPFGAPPDTKAGRNPRKDGMWAWRAQGLARGKALPRSGCEPPCPPKAGAHSESSPALLGLVAWLAQNAKVGQIVCLARIGEETRSGDVVTFPGAGQQRSTAALTSPPRELVALLSIAPVGRIIVRGGVGVARLALGCGHGRSLAAGARLPSRDDLAAVRADVRELHGATDSQR